jgi:hypothetical protein
MKASLLFLVFASLLTSGCASLNSVSLTPIPSDRRNEVQVQASRMIILGFNFDNDYVDQLVDQLKNQCPDGKVTGVLTKDETIMYFLVFVMKKQVTATGYCSRGTATQKKPAKRRATASETLPVETLEAE